MARWPLIAYDIKQGNLLGGKALTTFRAFPAAANFCAIYHRTGVNDSGIIVSAERANHLGVSPFEIPRISNKCMY